MATLKPDMAALLSKSLRNWESDALREQVVLQPDVDLLARIRAESPFVPKDQPDLDRVLAFGLDMAQPDSDTQAEIIQTKDGVHINLKLTVAEQRRIVEAETRQPCVRLWLSRGEHENAWKHAPDFTHGQLTDGRFYCWRKKADLDELARSTSPADVALLKALTARILRDDVR